MTPEQDQELAARIKLEFTCAHPGVRVVRFTRANGTSEFRRQCPRCGVCLAVCRKVDLAEAIMAAAPPWNQATVDAWIQARCDRWKELTAEYKAAEDAAWHDKHEAHLASPEWAWTREKVLIRARGICEGCGEAPATEVHHLDYRHLGEEFLWELVAVCRPCHARIGNHDE